LIDRKEIGLSRLIEIPVRTIGKHCLACGVHRTFSDAWVHEGRFRQGEFHCTTCHERSSIWLSTFRGSVDRQSIDLEPVWVEFHDHLLAITKRAALTSEDLINIHCLETIQVAAFRLGRRSWMDVRLEDVRRALASIETELANFGLRDITMESAFAIYSLLKDLQTARPLVIQVELGAAILSGNPIGVLAALVSTVAPDRVKRAMTVYLVGRVAWVVMQPD
jgi:hypothetical protein